jgi:hypothetical protein
VTITVRPPLVTLTITKLGDGNGGLFASPAGPSYDQGTVVTVTASPLVGSTFAGWGGCTTTSGLVCTVTMDANKSVTATFKLVAQTFTLTLGTAGSGSGTVSANPAGPSYAAGTMVTLTATPSAGSTFTAWSGACSGAGACVVTMDGNKSVTATFTLVPQTYTLTLGTTGTGSGTVTASPTGPSYAAGTLVTVTANPSAGSTFTGWSGACSGTGACIVTMDANKTVTATFSLAAAGEFYSGTAIEARYNFDSSATTGITCTPYPLVISYLEMPSTASLSADGSLLTPGAFSGFLDIGPRTVVQTVPTQTCVSQATGQTFVFPGSTQTIFYNQSGTSVMGTSDGTTVALSNPPYGWPGTGTLSVTAGIVHLTFLFTTTFKGTPVNTWVDSLRLSLTRQ